MKKAPTSAASVGSRQQAQFIASAMAALENAKASNTYVDADTILQTLERKLAAAKAHLNSAPKPRLP